MTVIKARLEKKLVEVETFVETSQLERVPPSPLLRALKNGEWLFYGSTDPKIAVEWMDTPRGVLT